MAVIVLDERESLLDGGAGNENDPGPVVDESVRDLRLSVVPAQVFDNHLAAP